ncbi:MAG: hypothetical protein JO219_09695 [Candidatus Eremiobacteraeota bacterium]|nr:hypothetical protein [Candidatus Eremiobacteraeota bacterium]MBV8366349.1 hypothetical protein [Candidatus Eremiobacteraeota bacterium]
MIGRLLRAFGSSLALGFASGVCIYAVATIVNRLWGPVFYTDVTLENHAGQALIYGIGSAAIIGAALFVSSLLFVRDRVPARTLAALAAIACAVQGLELGAIEAIAIRESNTLSWPIAEQLMPFNFGIFAPVGIWEGRPDAAFFWFSAAAAVLACAVIRTQAPRR